jgi:hypothetical protein
MVLIWWLPGAVPKTMLKFPYHHQSMYIQKCLHSFGFRQKYILCTSIATWCLCTPPKRSATATLKPFESPPTSHSSEPILSSKSNGSATNCAFALVEDIVVAPFDQIAGSAYGPVRFATRESRKDHLDKLIAAHAIALQVVLVTNNTKDFHLYPELNIENWLD